MLTSKSYDVASARRWDKLDSDRAVVDLSELCSRHEETSTDRKDGFVHSMVVC
jgi:hypothetical protein